MGTYYEARAERELAGQLNKLSRAADRTFAALHNAARRGFVAPSGALFVGKAECEWDYPTAWDELVVAGLIEYTIATRQGKGSIDGLLREFTWSITELGRQVRKDDTAFYREWDAERHTETSQAD